LAFVSSSNKVRKGGQNYKDEFVRNGFSLITRNEGPADCGTNQGCLYGDEATILAECDKHDCDLIQWCPADGAGLPSPSCHDRYSGRARACIYTGCSACTETSCDFNRNPNMIFGRVHPIGHWYTYFKADVPQVRYEILTSGKCTDVGSYIETEEECRAAAASVDWPVDDKFLVASRGDWPAGCWLNYVGNSARFNTMSDSTEPCQNIDRCLCKVEYQEPVTYECSLNSRHHTLANLEFTWSGPPGLTFDLAHTTGDASDGVCSRAHNDCMRRFNRLAGAIVASNGECVRGLNCDGVPDSALHEYYQNFQCAKVYTTSKPTFAPSAAPTTSKPTFAPSDVPTTSNPTSYPSVAPTTSNPTFYPSVAPTQRYRVAPYKMSRPDGLTWCADQGMGLVAPQSDEDIAEIQNLGLTHFIWLAIERDESNPSRWINTYSKEPLTYTNWNGAEGNNRGERFAIMRFDSGFSGRWFDWGNKHLKYDIVCDSEPRANSIFSAASEEDCIHEIFDIGRVFGTEAHTIHVKLDLPEYSDPRQWILNLGQETTGANHWIWRGETVQFGSWNGPQIRKVDINSCTDLTTTFDGKNTLTLYCNGKFLGQIENSNLHIRNSILAVAGNQRKEVPQGNFRGCVHYVEVWDYDLSSREVASLTKYAPKEQSVGY